MRLSRLSQENHERQEEEEEEEENERNEMSGQERAQSQQQQETWAPLNESISNLHIEEGVHLEARVYGSEDAPVQVVWGHGFGSSMSNEDKESLWNFWDVVDPNGTNTHSEMDDDGLAKDGDDARATNERRSNDDNNNDNNDNNNNNNEFNEAGEFLESDQVRIVRYNARGHGYSSPVEHENQALWENLAGDMLKVANLKQKTRISKKTGKEKKQKLILGGASMGAAVTLHAAVQNGDVVPDGLVLVIPPTIYESRRKREKCLIKKAAAGPPPPPRLRQARPIFDGEPEEIYVPRSVLEIGVSDESFVGVSLGAAKSNLPPKEDIANVIAKIPCLILAWDCGDKTHPLKSAVELKGLIPHSEMHVAQTLDDTKMWPGLIRDFIRGISRKSENVRADKKTKSSSLSSSLSSNMSSTTTTTTPKARSDSIKEEKEEEEKENDDDNNNIMDNTYSDIEITTTDWDTDWDHK